MIYKNANNITLYGEAVDDFLKSCGIELYSDCVVIGENTFSCEDGEAILNENGVFLYEDGIVLEGQQADDYRARKAKEIRDNKKIDIDRKERRYGYKAKQGSKGKAYYSYNPSMNGNTGSNSASDKERSFDVRNKMTSIENKRRFEYERSSDSYDKEYAKNNRTAYMNFMKNKPEATDALNRRYRRHPEANRAKTLRDSMRTTEHHRNSTKSVNTDGPYDYATEHDNTYESPYTSKSVTSRGSKAVVNRNYHYSEQSIFESVELI